MTNLNKESIHVNVGAHVGKYELSQVAHKRKIRCVREATENQTLCRCA